MKANIKNLSKIIIILILNMGIIISSAIINTQIEHATSVEEMVNAINQLSPEAQRYYSSYAAISQQKGSEYAMNNLFKLYQEDPAPVLELLNMLAKYSTKTEWIDRAKEAGIPVGSSANNSNTSVSQEQIPTKTEFTVTDCTPYPAWATQDCNIRSGADTTYDKAGSLKKFEQVTVTGTASTGWFRITTADGKEAYISNTLLTTEDPTSVSLVTVTEEGVITEHTVEGDDPEAVAQVVEQIKEESEPKEEAHEHSYTSSVTTEPTCSTVGTMTYTCECGDTYTEEIPKVEHTPGEWETTKKATLLSDGEKVQKCTVCGEVLATEVIPASRTILYVVIGACVAIAIAIVSLVIYKKKQ